MGSRQGGGSSGAPGVERTMEAKPPFRARADAGAGPGAAGACPAGAAAGAGVGEHAKAVPIAAGSLLWDLVGDVRTLLVFPAALLLQASHPAIGHAVGTYSVALTDPWGRAVRSLDSVGLWVYGGEAGLAEGRRLRRLHRPISGVDLDGHAYRALDPEPYAWVHGTAFWALTTARRLYGTPLRPDEEDQLYGEVRQLGRILGVQDRDMPATVSAYWAYFDAMVEETLVDHPTVRAVMAVSRRPPVPPWVPRPLAAAWAPVAAVGGPFGHWLTVGTFPPAMRRKLDLPWSGADERAMLAFAAAVRTVVPLAPERVRLAAMPMALHARRHSRSIEGARRRATASLDDRVRQTAR